MSTRTIVTSQPDVACDVCERRLLRGEQPDVFIAAGQRMTVCELCVPRATHEGWLRESEEQPVALPPLRPRRGRSFLERLPAPFRARQVGRQPVHAAGPAPDVRDGSDLPGGEQRPGARAAAEESALGPWAAAEVFDGDGEDLADGAHAAAVSEPSYVERAIDVFNASEFPRRVAGVARSLGAPEVSVRSAEHLDSVVVIVVAWELCWYRYEIDLSEGLGEARVREQGTELAELRREDRLANALAADSGALALAAASR